MTFRDAVPAVARTNPDVLLLLGTGDAQSVYPRTDDPRVVPPGIPPFIVGKRGIDMVFDRLTPQTPFEWWVYDDPGYGYTRIDALEAALIRAYNTDAHPDYADPIMPGWYQEYSGSSDDLKDDGWGLHLRIVRFVIWRAL